MGILAMTSNDMNWKLPLKMWMKTHAEDRQLLLRQLTETYLGNEFHSPCHTALHHLQVSSLPNFYLLKIILHYRFMSRICRDIQCPDFQKD